MTRTEIRRLRTALAGIAPTSNTHRFLATPDGADGPVLVVGRGRISPQEKLSLIQAGARRFLEGRLSRDEDGHVVFTGLGVTEDRLKAIVEPLRRDLPILADARAARS